MIDFEFQYVTVTLSPRLKISPKEPPRTLEPVFKIYAKFYDFSKVYCLISIIVSEGNLLEVNIGP